jgi:GDP/UDP-N,N'-diacetylbacillosamine 2-epimerase (hydrolysing)
LTKQSHIHLVQTKEAALNVSSMGEEDWRIIVAGAPGFENMNKQNLLSIGDIKNQLSIDLSIPTFLCTYHPVTLEHQTTTVDQINNFLQALRTFPEYQIVLTYPGVESESDEIIKLIKNFEKENDNVFLFNNLGSLKYLSIMKYSKCVVGNSSSGIIEAPSFHIPTVNIGTRQKGRVSAKSVIHCGYSCTEIRNALKVALSQEHEKQCLMQNPYEPLDGVEFSKIAVKVIIKMIDKKSTILNKSLSFEVKKNEWNSFVRN